MKTWRHFTLWNWVLCIWGASGNWFPHQHLWDNAYSSRLSQTQNKFLGILKHFISEDMKKDKNKTYWSYNLDFSSVNTVEFTLSVLIMGENIPLVWRASLRLFPESTYLQGICLPWILYVFWAPHLQITTKLSCRKPIILHLHQGNRRVTIS